MADIMSSIPGDRAKGLPLPVSSKAWLQILNAFSRKLLFTHPIPTILHT